MPTIDELAGIYDSERDYPMDCDFKYKVFTTKLIHTTCWGVWSSDILEAKSGIFDFNSGNNYLESQLSSIGFRGLPVRGDK